MQILFTIEELRNYCQQYSSYDEVLFNLTQENMMKANEAYHIEQKAKEDAINAEIDSYRARVMM